MKKVLICGSFGFKNMDTGGQPVKTRELYYGLQEQFGDNQVDYIETSGWKKHPISLFIQFFNKAHDASNIIMLPAHKGVVVFSRLLKVSKKINHNKIFYDVVGGWLPEKVEHDSNLKEILTKFDGIWVETTLMKDKLSSLGLKNVTLVRNFKNLTPVSITDLQPTTEGVLRACTFSRVIKEKGIEDAIEAIRLVNQSLDEPIAYLDIYGQIDDSYKVEFENICATMPKYVCYKGVVKPNSSVNVLVSYDVLLFPTYYEGEGLAGTLIDAFAAGLVIIATDWHYNSEFVKDSQVGFLVDVKNPEMIADRIRYLYDHKDCLRLMKLQSSFEYNNYSKEKVINQIQNLIEQNEN